MKRLLKPLKTTKAEGYIDTVVCVMAATMVIVLALNVFSFLTLTLFDDPKELERKQAEEDAAEEKERRIQKAMIQIKERYGANAILKGTNFQDGATARERNETIGGHKA